VSTRFEFPAARERRPLPLTALSDSFQRIQTTDGLVTLGDTDALLIEFSGAPDVIEVLVTTFDAIIRFTDRSRRIDSDVIVVAGGRYEHRGGGFDTLRARNRVGGSNAIVQAVGKWARPAVVGAPSAAVLSPELA
jgi:hypothetical protein